MAEKPTYEELEQQVKELERALNDTEQKKAIDVLYANERRFQELIKNSSDSIVILDKDGLQTYVSDVVEKHLGFKPHEVTNISVIEEMIHPDDQQKTMEAFEKIIEEGEGGVQYRHRHKNGSWVYLEAWGTNQLKNPDIQGVVVNVRNITEWKKTEKALKEIEKRYRRIEENITDVLWTMDMNFQSTYVTPSIYEQRGYTVDEVANQSLEDRISPDSLDMVLRIIDEKLELINTGNIKGWEPIVLEIEQPCKDGSTIWTSNIVKFIPDTDNKPASILGTSRDITARKKAEEALQESEARISEINHCFINFTSDPLENINRLTSLCGEFFNATYALYNRLDTALLCSLGKWNTPSDYNPVDKPDGHICYDVIKNASDEVLFVPKLQDTHYAQTDPNVVPYKLQTYVGKAVKFFDTYIGSLCIVFQDDFVPSEADKKILGILASAIGVEEERRHTMIRLQLSEGRFRKILEDISNIAVQGYDVRRRVTFWNKASEKLYGYSEKEALGKKVEDLIIPIEMKEGVKRLIQRWIDYGEKIPASELELVDKYGNNIPVFSSHAMHEMSNQKEIFCIDVDLRPIKQAEEEKIQAQHFAAEQEKHALVGQIAGKMAHDFNNILGIIMGNTEISLLDCKDAETRKTLELIFEQTLRGKNLTRNLVAFAKDQEPKQEFFKINEKIDLVVNLMRRDLSEIELIREESLGVPELLADPGMIEHAFVNLIQNSIHATSMSVNPQIIIRTYSRDNNIFFEIEDNGCGIPKEHVESIFEPSFTLKGTRDITNSYKADIKGTGYGMANVEKYIEQHRGNISVDSKINSGTTFTICLPVVKKELTNKEKIELREEITHFKKYILLVEDETAIANVQYKILTNEPCNHKVDIANTGQIAMDLFDRNKYDLISLDYILSDNSNGMNVYNYIRKTNKIVPILFISGNIDFLESIKGLKQNDSNLDHLSKPCQNKDYVNTINNLLETF